MLDISIDRPRSDVKVNVVAGLLLLYENMKTFDLQIDYR